MNNQDFEAYANFKRFNTVIAETWDTTLTEAIKLTGKPIDQIRFLDYGCGDGKYYAHLIQNRGLASENIYGVEVSSQRITRCQEIGWKKAQLINPNDTLPFESNSFDIINMMEVIEHIPAQKGKETVAELKRVLAPNGVLLISTPNYPIKRFYDYTDALFHGKWSRLKDDPTHVTPFSHSKLNTLLSEVFNKVDARIFKPGFLYKRVQKPFFQHKLFFICRA